MSLLEKIAGNRHFLGPKADVLLERFQTVDWGLLAPFLSDELGVDESCIDCGVELSLLLMGELDWQWLENRNGITEVLGILGQNFRELADISERLKPPLNLPRWEVLTDLLVAQSFGQSVAVAELLGQEVINLSVAIIGNRLKASYICRDEAFFGDQTLLIDFKKPKFISEESVVSLAALRRAVPWFGIGGVIKRFAVLAAADSKYWAEQKPGREFEPADLVVNNNLMRGFWGSREWVIDLLHLQRT